MERESRKTHSRKPSPRKTSDRPRSDKPRSDKPRSDKPRSDKPRSDKPRSDRPRSDKPNSGRPRSSRPSSDRPRSDRPRPQRGGSERRSSAPRTLERDENRRVRKFAEPPIPEDVTGKELEKRDAFALQSLAAENAEAVAKHLVCINLFLESDPERAYWHGQAAVFRAGRVAIVRERAGIAAVHFKKFDVAQKELRTAQRISGSQTVLPYLAQCELALGNPRKTLEIAGSVDPKVLTSTERVELRLAAAGARSALGQHDAAVVTLTCPELADGESSWSRRLRSAYRDSLITAGRMNEAEKFESKYPQSFIVEEKSV